MATIRVDIKEAGALFRRMGERLPGTIEKGVRSFVARAKPMMVQATDQAVPANPRGVGRGAVNTGNYRRRWKAEVLRGERLPGAVVANDTPYAGVIEYGRRAGARMPPVDALARWAQRKLGMPYKKAKGIAFAIAKSIKRRGLKPRYVLTRRLQQRKLENAFREEVMRALIVALTPRA